MTLLGSGSVGFAAALETVPKIGNHSTAALNKPIAVNHFAVRVRERLPHSLSGGAAQLGAMAPIAKNCA
jgi:hypothetical protein